MGKHARIKKHLHTFDEVRDIMTAMKNLSIIELNKLTQLISAQEKAAKGLEKAVSDFLSFYSVSRFHEERKKQKVPYFLVGSERGFCGGFNEALVKKLEELLAIEKEAQEPVLLLVGKKLASKFYDDPRVVQTLSGPTSAEEIPGVIVEAVGQLTQLGKTHPELWLRHLTILHNREEKAGTEVKVLRPFARFFHEETRLFPFPPQLNLSPRELFNHLTDHYLFSKLHEVFYFSEMAEQRARFQHVEGAIRFLDKEITRLTLRRNQLRQEEITEEIEVILLGTHVSSGASLG